MSNTMRAPEQSMPVHSLETVGPKHMAKAEIASSLGAVVREGLIRACGSLKAAAVTMEIDQSQLTRDLYTGKFNLERLGKLSVTERAVVIETMHAEVAPLSTPKARLREINRQRRQLDEEADQIIEGLAS